MGPAGSTVRAAVSYSPARPSRPSGTRGGHGYAERREERAQPAHCCRVRFLLRILLLSTYRTALVSTDRLGEAVAADAPEAADAAAAAAAAEAALASMPPPAPAKVPGGILAAASAAAAEPRSSAADAAAVCWGGSSCSRRTMFLDKTYSWAKARGVRRGGDGVERGGLRGVQWCGEVCKVYVCVCVCM